MGLENHIFIDNAPLAENVKQQVTSFVTLGKNYIHYTITDKDKNRILFAKTLYNSDGSIGQPEFDTLLADSLLRNSSEVHLAIDTVKQTLIPAKLLAGQNREFYFNHIHEIEKDEEILSQQVNDDIIELYIVKKSTISYLKNEFKQITLYSHSACLIATYMEMSAELKTTPFAFLHTAHDTFYFTFFKAGKLHFYQSFDLTSASDVLYCLLNVLQWQQVEMSEVKLFLTGFSHQQSEIAALLGSYFKTDTFDENSFNKKVPVAEQFPLHILFNQYSLFSCVS